MAQADEQLVGDLGQVGGQALALVHAADGPQELADEVGPFLTVGAPGSAIEVFQANDVDLARGVGTVEHVAAPAAGLPIHSLQRFAEGEQKGPRIPWWSGTLARIGASARRHDHWSLP